MKNKKKKEKKNEEKEKNRNEVSFENFGESSWEPNKMKKKK